jgi:hypothetical protein
LTRDHPSLLLDSLSDRVLRNLSPTIWRKLFLRPHHEVMRFERVGGTLLYARAQVPPWSAGAQVVPELAFLATVHGGDLDPCPPGTALVRFDDARSALNMALDMQQLSGDVRFQIGLVTGEMTLATLQLEDGELHVLLGEAVDRAEAVTRLAAPGSIRLAPETYADVHDPMMDMTRGVLTTEYEEDCMTAVCLTLPPRSNSQMSSFAGLGLT